MIWNALRNVNTLMSETKPLVHKLDTCIKMFAQDIKTYWLRFVNNLSLKTEPTLINQSINQSINAIQGKTTSNEQIRTEHMGNGVLYEEQHVSRCMWMVNEGKRTEPKRILQIQLFHTVWFLELNCDSNINVFKIIGFLFVFL